MFGEKLFIRFTVYVYLSKVFQFVCAFASFPFSFEGEKWDLIVLFPGHCLSFYFQSDSKFKSYPGKKHNGYVGKRLTSFLVYRAGSAI